MKRLSCSYELVEGIAVVAVEGYLDMISFVDLQELLSKIIEEGGNKKVIINMSHLNYISAAGLGVVMEMLNKAREKGGDIKLCSLSSKVASLLFILGFDRIIRILDGEEEARQEFARDGGEKMKEGESEARE